MWLKGNEPKWSGQDLVRWLQRTWTSRGLPRPAPQAGPAQRKSASFWRLLFCACAPVGATQPAIRRLRRPDAPKGIKTSCSGSPPGRRPRPMRTTTSDKLQASKCYTPVAAWPSAGRQSRRRGAGALGRQLKTASRSSSSGAPSSGSSSDTNGESSGASSTRGCRWAAACA